MNYNQRTLSGNGWGFNSGPVGREPGGGGSSVSVFNDLLDVNCPTPGDHHVPIYNLGAGEWQCGLLDLDQLDDVTLTAPALNNVLVRSFTDWVNVDFETFFASLNISIDKLGDVDLTGITTGQILQFNGTNLVPVTPSGGGNVTTASGVAPKLAYWTSVSNIEEVPIAEYDAANTLLKFNNATRSTAVFGHHFTNSWRLSWRNGGGTADLLVALDKSNRWIFSPSDVGNVNVDFAGFPGTGADQNFRFQNTSTGLGNLVAEGYIAAHQNSAFGGTLAASGAGRFRNNTFIGWRSTTNTRDVSFGVTNADFYLFDETTAGGGNTDLALNGGSATDWRIRASNVGSG